MSEMDGRNTSKDNPEIRHEPSDINVRSILWAGIGLVILAGIVHVFLWWLFDYYVAREAGLDRPRPLPLATRPSEPLPPEPRLQASPARDMNEMRTAEEARLHSYGWIDQKAGIIRIPVEQAMRLVAERGLPAGPEGEAQKEERPQAVEQEPAEGPKEGALAAEGEKLFAEIGCNACHKIGEKGRGPDLQGVFGHPVKLQTGETVLADEGYLRESILHPSAKIVAGYRPLMPPYEGRVSEEELSGLIAYIKSLGTPQAPASTQTPSVGEPSEPPGGTIKQELPEDSGSGQTSDQELRR